MVTFKQFLAEATRVPSASAWVKAKLIELKPILWERGLHLNDILAALNREFAKLMIRFDAKGAYRNSDNGNAGIGNAQYSPSGWITVHLLDDVDDVLNNKHRVKYEDFAHLCYALIAHELNHREQVLKHDGDMDNPKDPENQREYLSDHRELESYVIQACLELQLKLDKKDILGKLGTTAGVAYLAKHSDSLNMYLTVFHSPSHIMQKFLKKLHDVLRNSD